MTFEEALKKAKSKGDVATILICGSGGFLVDVLTSLHGFISPGYFAGAAATAGLGLKNAVDAGLAHRRATKASDRRSEGALDRAQRVMVMLSADGSFPAEVTALEKDLILCRAGLIAIEQWRQQRSGALTRSEGPRSAPPNLRLLELATQVESLRSNPAPR
jgi:hypothetical protein